MTGRARAATLLLLIAACGLKSAPVAPELVQPTPPATVRATSVGAGIRLAWRRPTRYTGGGRMRDLGGFEVERAPAPGGPFAQVGTVHLADQQRFQPLRDLEWTDADVRAGEHYVYRVIAFTVDGDRSAPSPPAAVRYEPGAPAPARTPGGVP